ncbi:DUF1810 domain-containing protein [Caulobacter sp. S45]|uniref:DUF1810 domain-containing protein n=1 Tax=Caulobacter sp. S45 TaxID=1641861 RepID=UPI0015768898|nr:DUF1810 domain-containing protein [Caulobacter sp. S45]
MPDAAFDLDRFVQAQAGVYATALAELQRGRKTSHWMWFVFPQIAGLGFSPMARRYAIADLEEATAYLAHPVLGPRLRQSATAAVGEGGRSASHLFGHPDDLKFRSSMTLFELADRADDLFGPALASLCGGARDEATLRLVKG